MADKLPTKTAEVNIIGVYPPKKKPQWGSIKVDPPVEDNEWLDIWHENLTEFDVGPAIISYTTKDKDDGGVWVTARRMRALGKQAAKGNGGLRAAPGKPAAMGGEKDRMIWLMNQTTAMMEVNGKMPDADEYRAMIDLALRGYEYQRKLVNPQHADDMNDEIPDFGGDK